MERFKPATRAYLDGLIRRRAGETKFGEGVQVLGNDDLQTGLRNSPARYVLLGIPEDIGVRANEGVGGAHTLWEPALSAILNVQETEMLSVESLLILGAFDFSEWMRQSEDLDVAGLRALVALMDEEIYPVIREIVAAGKVAIVIGGGHNNAYPLLKGVSLALGRPVNCINLDAHSDYRIMEGRHSGNGFRYAKQEQYLSRYAMAGLHRSYNSRQVIADIIKEKDLLPIFYEAIFLKEPGHFAAAIRQAIQFTAGGPTGIELDLDSIAGILSSAATPCGITSLQARQYLLACRQHAEAAYFHLAEGAVQLRDGRADNSTAKLTAYLVTDVIRKPE